MTKFIWIFAVSVFIVSCSKDSTNTNSGSSNNTWVELANTNSAFGISSKPVIFTMCSDNNNNIYVAGTLFSGVDGYFVAKWDGSKWSRIGVDANALNANSFITQLCSDNKGNIYATGNFTDATGNLYVAKWNGINWISISSPKSLNGNTDYVISSLISDVNNNLYIATHGTGGSQYPVTVYKWDGSNWLQLGRSIVVKEQLLNFAPLYGNSPALSVGNDGSIYYTGDSTNNVQTVAPFPFLAKLNGINLEIIKGANNYSLDNVSSICSSVKYGLFCITYSSAGTTSVLNWQNSKWTDLGYGNNLVNTPSAQKILCSDMFGNVYLAGRLKSDNLNYISKFDGNTWTNIKSPISNNPIDFSMQIIVDKKGNLYAVSTNDSSKVLMLKH